MGPFGQTREIETVVDTGYTGFLLLPPALVAELGLAYRSSGGAVLADGTEAVLEVYSGVVLWDGQRRIVRIDAAGDTPLAGMRLLAGFNLNIDVRQGGTVLIREEGSLTPAQ